MKYRICSPLMLGFVFLLSTVGALLYSGVSYAASDTWETSGYQGYRVKNLPRSGNHLYMSNQTPSGASGNYVPMLTFLVYRQAGEGNVDVNIDTNFNCDDFQTIRIAIVTNDDTAGWNTPITGASTDIEGNGSYCHDSGSTLRLTIPESYSGNSIKFGDDYKTSRVYMRLQDSGSRTGNLSISVGGAAKNGPKLGFIGARNVGDNDVIDTRAGYQYSKYAPSITRNYSGWGNIEVEFGPPCDQTIGTSVYYKDADSHTQANGPSPPGMPASYYRQVDYGIFRQQNNGNWPASPIIAGEATGGKTNFSNTSGFSAVEKENYKVTFSGVAGDPFNNTIQILLPFDQAGYADECPPDSDPDGWTSSWTNNEVEGGSSAASVDPTNIGNVGTPDSADAPRVDQSFKYINTIRNNGSLPMSGPFTTGGDSYTDGSFFYLHFGYKAGATAPYTGSDLYGNTAGQIHIRNAVNDNRTGENYAANYADAWAGYNTAAGSSVGDPWSNNYGSFTVGAGDGGRVRCITTSYNPTKGTRDEDSPYDAPSGANFSKNEKWTYSGSDSSQLCVSVPWYYTLNSTLVVTGASSGTIQQGEVITATGTITNPPNDGAGRKHTDSISKESGIIELKLNSGQQNISDTSPAQNIALNPCDHIKSRSAGLGDCTYQDNANRVIGGGVSESIAGGRDAAATSNFAVGTKLCYASYTQHPRNTTSGEYASGDSYYTFSNIDCTVIVKAPKVHFRNTDVTVGRHRSTVDNPCSDPINASIVTAGAPTVKDDQLAGNGNMYGSWVEYGAFATGSISGFGSAATPHGFVNNTIVQPQRLTFGNDGALGNFAAYGQTLNCLPNPFEDVNDDNTTDLEGLPTADAQNSFETAGANKGNLYLNELAEKTTANDDKKGYIAKGSNIKLTPRSPTAYTADVSVEARPYLFGADCPQINITIFVAGVVTDSEPLDYCNDAGYETKTVNLNLGSVGYNGPSKVRIEYVNDAWVGGDRNIEVRNVNVKFNNNNTQQSHNVKDLPISNRVYDSSYAAKRCEGPSVVTSGNGLLFRQSSASSSVGADGDCYGVEIYRNPDLSSITSMPPPPNLLNPSYTGFQSRDMVLYAKKADPTKKCTAVENAASGNILIDQDIIYSRTGFNSVLQLPRLVFVADCSITISDAVREVDASLVAGDAIKTCSAQRKTKDECNQNLVVRGGISANRLLLWRTFGADLQNDDGAGTPAENFDLSPSQMIANYKRGLGSATFSTTSESDLPPRY